MHNTEGSDVECASFNSDAMRTRFSLALSEMYRTEVPLYGTLMDIVGSVDASVLAAESMVTAQLPTRHQLERHGAIRLGMPEELATIGRLFALLGMHGVGYYALTAAGLPLHATAFRPISEASLRQNPFRVFTSLLRKDLLPVHIQRLTEKILRKRRLFSPRLLNLLNAAEAGERFSSDDQTDFVLEMLNIFRWHSRTSVSVTDYAEIKRLHPIVADIVCFPSAHINHLTPRTLDIDLVQKAMQQQGMPAKDRIEGPPRRKCSILLRQTSFKALEEKVDFVDVEGSTVNGVHAARFGEVEQRGAALTPKGRQLFDKAMQAASQQASGQVQDNVLSQTFQRYFPDSWEDLRAQGLVYFTYKPCPPPSSSSTMQETKGRRSTFDLDDLIKSGCVTYEPVVYEDFLPLSAAGIFKSNVAPTEPFHFSNEWGDRLDDRQGLEIALGCRIRNEFDLYHDLQERSLEDCRRALGLSVIKVSRDSRGTIVAV